MKKRSKKWIKRKTTLKKLIKEAEKELRDLQAKIPILRAEIIKAQHTQLRSKLQKTEETR
ncbi:hypothetical protein NDK43_06765 [Neobacillus pocheonensis]|uniref:Uncharacterized protein n=1 Tax=Neobacillus pocheonensis TaxID=363869 RepID=A0ABT0WAX4_9BACI|nr:hypothetical protein [Neobacillus pocheonensis]